MGACFSFGVNEDNFFEKLVGAQCDFSQRCDAFNFYAEYDDNEECVDELNEYLEPFAELAEDCDFDDDAARACLDALASDCKTAGEDLEDLSEDCGEVYDCSDASSDDTG